MNYEKRMIPVLIVIFFLTVLDAICTAVGVSNNLILEGNPLLRSPMTRFPLQTSVFICTYVGLILFGISQIRKKARWLLTAMLLVLAVKIAVIWMHAAWIGQLLTMSKSR